MTIGLIVGFCDVNIDTLAFDWWLNLYIWFLHVLEEFCDFILSVLISIPKNLSLIYNINTFLGCWNEKCPREQTCSCWWGRYGSNGMTPLFSPQCFQHVISSIECLMNCFLLLGLFNCSNTWRTGSSIFLLKRKKGETHIHTNSLPLWLLNSISRNMKV